MKKIKRILALLVAMVMVMGMTVTASAATVPLTGAPSADDRGIITVQGVEEGATVTAYQVVRATYDEEDGSFTGYEALAGSGITNIENITGTLVDGMAQKIKNNELKAFSEIQLKYDANKKTYRTVDESGNANAPVGSYVILVVAPKGSTVVYSPLYGSVAYGTTDEGDGNTIEQGEINVINSDNLWTKHENGPVPEKKIKDVTNDDTKNSVTIGSVITYTVSATLPDYRVGYKDVKFNFVDTLSEGLTYNSGSYEVFVDGKKVENNVGVTEEISGQVVTFKLSSDFIKANSTKTVSIEYTATVNENAASGFDPNTNEVKLDYSNSPDTSTESTPDETYNYTFDIDGILRKVDNKNEEKRLENAEFALFTDPNCETRATYPNGNEIPVAKTGQDGNIKFTQLNEGTYYLQETKAPEGYQLSKKVYEIVIAAEYDAEGKMTKYTITITDMDTHTQVENIYLENNSPEHSVVNVKNTTLSSLPSTGGIGTTIFTIGGCAIMIAAAGLFFASRRKSAK